MAVNTSPRNAHLDMMRFWQYDLPLHTQWMVLIYDFPQIIRDSIQSLEGLIESDWNIAPETWDMLTNNQAQNRSSMGCFFAQTVSQIPESHGVGVANIDNNGGFLPGVVSTGRSDTTNRSLNIGFRDTNLSFVDLVIRPWTIVASHMGRIATTDPAQNIKSTRIQTVHFTRRIPGGSPDRPIRKIVNYYGCTPFAVADKTYDYTGEDFDKSVMGTQWVYDNYSVQTDFIG